MSPRPATSAMTHDLIAQFYQDFPQQQGRTFFLLHGSGDTDQEKHALAGIRREIHAKIKDKPVGMVGRMAADLWARYHYSKKNLCVVSYIEKPAAAHFDIPAHIVFLPHDLTASAVIVCDDFADEFRKLTGRTVKRSLRKMLLTEDAFAHFIFDHETAHARLMDGMPRRISRGRDTDNYNECMADAYAVLRHLVRGGNVRFAEGLIAARTVATVGNGDAVHHTCAAVAMARDIYMAGEVKDGSPQALSDLAVRIAQEIALVEKDMGKITSVFNNAAARAAAGRFHDLSMLDRAREFFNRLRQDQPEVTPDAGQQYRDFMGWMHTVGSKTRLPAVTDVSMQFFQAAVTLLPKAERKATSSFVKKLKEEKPEVFAKAAAQSQKARARILDVRTDARQSDSLRHRIFGRNKKPAT